MRLSRLLIIAALVSPSSAMAIPPLGLSFSHHDWELACDNTRTCRAAGYQPGPEDDAISVLLTRHAGPSSTISAQVMIGDYNAYDDRRALDSLPPEFHLTMSINGEYFGGVDISQQTLVADLTDAQLTALLKALRRDSRIVFSSGTMSWRLSDRGASAVLLKMDDYQGRIGTPGAITRKGLQPEATVLPALPMPQVTAAMLPDPLPGDERFVATHKQVLREALRQSVSEDDYCPDLSEGWEEDAELEAQRLSDTMMLVSTACWRGAYNFGYGYWIVDAMAPQHAMLVTTSGSDYADGRIQASHKARGLGDCWSHQEWTWDGESFVPTASSTTGMCKLLAPGGAWLLPTLVTEVVVESSDGR